MYFISPFAHEMHREFRTTLYNLLYCPTKADRKVNPKILQWINAEHIEKEDNRVPIHLRHSGD